jgi:thiosulfate/3-mercaptopyruvate sulfurtransferase
LKENYVNQDILVSTDWLQAHLYDSDIRIVDCDMLESFKKVHIEGAVNINAHHYVKHPNYATDPKGYPWVAEPMIVKELFENMGIRNSTTVVSYDSNGGLWAARFWWVLNYYGHVKSKVLNGGWKKWFEEQRPISINVDKYNSSDFNPVVQQEFICTLDTAIGKVGNNNSIFIDTRSDQEWNGINDRGNARRGRIPGSVHIEWTEFLENDTYQTFKSQNEILSILKSQGVIPEKEIITY